MAISELDIFSDQLDSFPLTRRLAEYPLSRVASEGAFTRILRLLSYNNDNLKTCGSFIVDANLVEGSDILIEFTVGGYYFKVPTDIFNTWLGGSDDLYVGIKTEIVTGGSYAGFTEAIVNEDSGTGICKVLYYSSTPESDFSYYIHLIKDGAFNEDVFLQKIQSPYVISDVAPTSTADKYKIWIDSSNNKFTANILVGSTWISLGAVYK